MIVAKSFCDNHLTMILTTAPTALPLINADKEGCLARIASFLFAIRLEL